MERSILIVDDDHASAVLLAELLDEEGYRVRCAGDGQAALREVAQAPPDLVLSDVMMPKMDGVTLAKQLRARGWTMPVVLMSAEVAAVDLPGVPFLLKPLDLDDLLGTIARIVAA
jgi:CheY-like chemotaxis protein